MVWHVRGATRCPVSFIHLNSLPNGNAVVFLEGTSKVDGIGAMAQGASIFIQTHPNNPSARLLVIAGGNAEELARAARALALQSPTFTGQGVQIAKETPAAPRKPYDAPAWIPTDRPVRLGEIASRKTFEFKATIQTPFVSTTGCRPTCLPGGHPAHRFNLNTVRFVFQRTTTPVSTLDRI